MGKKREYSAKLSMASGDRYRASLPGLDLLLGMGAGGGPWVPQATGLMPAALGQAPQKPPGQIPCQHVALYGCEFWWDPREIGRQEDLQLLLNRQARSTMGALPRTPMGALVRESGLTPAPVALTARQERFTARLASACEGSNLKAVHDHPTSGAPICRVITMEHERGLEAKTMRWPNPDKELAVKMVIMSEDTAAQHEAIR